MIQEIHLLKQNDTRIFVKNTRAMITKLTLTVEKSVIDQAKIVAKASGPIYSGKHVTNLSSYLPVHTALPPPITS